MARQKSRARAWVAGILSSVVFATAAIGNTAPSTPTITEPEVQQAQSENQQLAERQHRTLTLPNGLSVLLTHDPDAQSSAAAMAIGVGFIDDPENMPGLAHYLEHMLFLGTEDFPQTGSYKSYLSANGGGSNAYTTLDHTNYFFQVQHDAFDGALDRFSDFFKAPLFDVTYAEREVQAVNEEFNKRYRSDGVRINSVNNELMKPGHPAATFGVGNAQTLGQGYNQQALRDFFESFYAASNMKLVLISNKSLDEMEKMAKEHFGAIRDFQVTHAPVDQEFIADTPNSYTEVEVEAINDIRIMRLSFPTIQLDEHNDTAPAWIVNSVLGYEGQGSLISKLKEEGLAEGLYAGQASQHDEMHSMMLNIGLTPKGMQNRERVLELVFSYIEMVKDHGIALYSFDEKKSMSDIAYRWQTPSEGSDYAKTFSSLMLSFDLDELHTTPFMITGGYSPKDYRAVLETMTPDNMTAMVIGRNMQTDQKTQYYDAEYGVTEISGERYDRLVNPPDAAAEGMSYPAPNPYIPNQLVLEPIDAETSAHNQTPHLVVDSDIAEIWSQYDTKFNQPKIDIELHIETPRTYDTVENYVKAKLLDSCIYETVSERAYPLQAAGLAFGITVDRNGFKVELGGYNQRLDELAQLTTESLTACEIDAATFETIRNRFIREIQNEQIGSATDRASRLSSMLMMDIYPDAEKLHAAQQLTLEDVQNYAKKAFQQIHIKGTAYGNLNDEDVRGFVNSLTQKLGSQPLPEEDRADLNVADFDPGEDVIYSTQIADNNNAILYQIMLEDSRDPETIAAIQLLNTMVSSDFYKTLRTDRQMGYIVASYPGLIDDTLSMNFLIQSSHGPVRLEAEIKDWIAGAMNVLDSISDEEFETYKQSLAENIVKEPTTIRETNQSRYYAVQNDEVDFERDQKMAEATRNLTREDVRALAQSLFENDDTPTLSVQIRAANNNNPVPDGAFTEIDAFKNRKTTPMP